MAAMSIDVNVPQAYLELARSYVAAIAHSKVSDLSKLGDVVEPKFATTVFAFMSLSTIFSYSAIESFVNYALYDIWSQSRHAHEAVEKMRLLDPSRRYVPVFDGFYQKFGQRFPFSELRKTRLRELTERIKSICKAHDFPCLPQTDAKLWNGLLNLEQMRHQLIHPIPEQAEFNNVVQSLVSTESYALYPQTAASVIRFFYESAKLEPPGFLSANELFNIRDIQVLY